MSRHYCTTSKNLKGVPLTRYVPPLKKSLEMFVFRVKAVVGREWMNQYVVVWTIQWDTLSISYPYRFE